MRNFPLELMGFDGGIKGNAGVYAGDLQQKSNK